MSDNGLNHQIETLRQRVAAMQGQSMEDSGARAEVWPEVFEELLTTLEELSIADEELVFARQTAEAERQRYQELFDFAPDGYLVTDAAGTIQEANRAAAALLAVPQKYLVGKPLLVFVAEAERQSVRIQLARLAQLKHVENWEVCLRPRQGAPFYAALTVATVCDAQSTLVGLRWRLHDITTRKRTEETLQQAHAELEHRVVERTAELQWVNAQLQAEIMERQQLEEEVLKTRKIESLGVLAGGIAHDFNNVLTAVMGNVSLAKMLADPQQKIAVILGKAETACQRATALTQQLLTFAKGGAPIRQTTSLATLITESAGFVLHGSNVRGEFSLPDDLWPVEADPGQIHQVLHNLFINADQAMPDGGLLQVQAENFLIEADAPQPQRPGKWVKISVSDQGSGIPAEHLPNIFDPYFTTKQRGTGLGLATAYAIISKHEGYMTVESEVGCGTTFHIYLQAAHEALSTLTAETRALGGTGKILVMDDDEMVRELVDDMLTNMGYEVEGTSDGAEMIALYQDAKACGQPFAVVILDLTIPGGMGGKEAIAKLRQIDPQVKAIVSSGYSQDPVMADFRTYGFSGVMTKPYTVQALGQVLQRVLTDRGT